MTNARALAFTAVLPILALATPARPSDLGERSAPSLTTSTSSSHYDAAKPHSENVSGDAPRLDSTPPELDKPDEAGSTRLRSALISPAEANVRYAGPAKFRDTTTREISSWETRVSLIALLHRGSRFSVAVALAYEQRRIDVDNSQGVDPKRFSLHRFELAPTLAAAVAEQHRLVVRLGAVLASNLNDVDQDAFQPSVQAFDRWLVSESVALSLGAGVSRQFLETVPYPLLGITWAPPDAAWRLDVLLPKGARAAWRIAAPVEVALDTRYEGRVWQIADQSGLVDHLAKSAALRVGPSLRLALGGPVELELAAGVQTLRRVTLRTDAGDADDTLDASPYVQAGLRLAN